MTDCSDISSEIALRWTSLDLSDDKLTLFQVMAWCCLATTSHYLSQCWPRSMSPNGVTRSQSVNLFSLYIDPFNCDKPIKTAKHEYEKWYKNNNGDYFIMFMVFSTDFIHECFNCNLILDISYHQFRWIYIVSTCKTSCISRTKFQNLNVSCLLLQWSLPNPLKPGVKFRMKM